MMQKGLLFFLPFILLGCSPSNLEDYHDESRGVMKQIVNELTKIKSKEKLMESSNKLKKLYLEWADNMIQAKEFKDLHPYQEIPELSPKDKQLNLKLEAELQRLRSIEGGWDVLEKCQQDALNKLLEYDLQRKRDRLKG